MGHKDVQRGWHDICESNIIENKRGSGNNAETVLSANNLQVHVANRQRRQSEQERGNDFSMKGDESEKENEKNEGRIGGKNMESKGGEQKDTKKR